MPTAPNFIPGNLPAGIELDKESTAILSRFSDAWGRIVKPLAGPESEMAKLRTDLEGLTDRKTIGATAASISGLETSVKAHRIEVYSKLISLLMGLADEWPAAFLKSVRASHEAAIHGAIAREKAVREKLEAGGAAPLVPGHGDQFRIFVLRDKEFNGLKSTELALSAYLGTFRTDSLLSAIEVEINKLDGEIAMLKNSFTTVAA